MTVSPTPPLNEIVRTSCAKCGNKLGDGLHYCETCSWLLGMGRKKPTHSQLIALGLGTSFYERVESEPIPFDWEDEITPGMIEREKQESQISSVYNGDRLENLFNHRN